MIIITAQEYFQEISFLLESKDIIAQEKFKRSKFLLERLCKQATATNEHQFSNLFSRLAWINQHLLQQYPDLIKSLQSLRYQLKELADINCHKRTPFSLAFIYPLIEAVATLLDAEIPSELQISTSKNTVKTEPTASQEHIPANYLRLRARHIKSESELLLVEIDHPDFEDPTYIRLRKEANGSFIFSETLDTLRPGQQINLLQVSTSNQVNVWLADIIVLEPDFLLDISTLAECFKDYGSHPLTYFMQKLTPDQNTHYMLLGNIANQFLDDIVNETLEEPADYLISMQKAFRLSPIALATCDALENPQTQKEFFDATKTQFANIRQVVEKEFSIEGFNREEILLEPAFVCESLGIQGRLDLLQGDFSRFIELKSGKANELYPSGQIQHKENHFVQMMLYYAVLQFNLGMKPDAIQAYLLYSRYPLLYHMGAYWGLLKQAINVRNQIVGLEYAIQKNNNIDYSKGVLQTINADTLNTRALNSRFWQNYLRKPIDEFALLLSQMSDLENDYFYSLFNFIIREQYTAKAGDVDAEFKRGISSLWEASLAEKLDAGEIIPDLRLCERKIVSEKHKLTFEIPKTNVLTLPNFRQGDAVMLYQRVHDSDRVMNKQVFKASIEYIDAYKLTLSLRVIQRNPIALPFETSYAIERDHLDSSFSSMLKGLAQFLQATEQRKSLLLAQRMPHIDRSLMPLEEKKTENDFERIVRKSVQAQDYFLLVGPPGTGKTSCALQQMVSTFYQEPETNILLLAYTNKAVDEICGSISEGENPTPFVRIGQESSCDMRYRGQLLQNIIKDCGRRTQVIDAIKQYRVFVGTVSSFSRQTDLFKLKSFKVAIIDEASQILEPQLLGLLTAKDRTGKDAIQKFIMIGDHKQLPAVVIQPSEVSEISKQSLIDIGMHNLNESLFQRLYRVEMEAGRTDFIDMLSRQGRMHQDISEFVSEHFYHGELQTVPLPHQHESFEVEHIPMDDFEAVVKYKRFAFFPVQKLDTASPNKVNAQEAKLVARIIATWTAHQNSSNKTIDLAKEIGIITPYRSQIAMIRKELQAQQIPSADHIVIDTVERFQGGQRNLMIYSCCMNAPYQMNFLSNTMVERGKVIDRKLNVALTRARKQMFVVGNPEVLKRDPIYYRLLHYLEEKNNCYHPPLE